MLRHGARGKHCVRHVLGNGRDGQKVMGRAKERLSSESSVLSA